MAYNRQEPTFAAVQVLRRCEIYKEAQAEVDSVKIALISPRGKVSNNPEFVAFWENTPEIIPYRETFTGSSSGLLIIAALTPKTWQVELIDENLEPIDFDKDYDMVAIGFMTQQSKRAYEIADAFRVRGITVVMGGIHATLLPEEAKEHADSVIVGEAEDIWPKVLSDFLDKDLKPFYRMDKTIDISKSPLPRYELLKAKKYKAVWIQTSRGCPLDCDFCCASNLYGRKFRYKKASQIMKELNRIVEIWGRNILISFADDNMFVDKKYASALLKEIGELKIRWFVQSDISVADDDRFLQLLRRSGCAILFIGFESLNRKNLDSINKNKRKTRYLEDYSSIIGRIQGHGIGVMASFVVGFDEDDVCVFGDLSRFIVDNNIFASQISILTPLPGTRLRNRLADEGRILPTGWDNYTFTDVNFVPNKMSAKELQDGLLEVYKKVYSKDARLNKAMYFKKVYLSLSQERG
jgi:radical SAM superfamily enzyme YgiQ (UPF0313 family)